MTFNWFEKSSEGAKFVLAIALMVGFMAIGLILSIIIALPFYPHEIAQMLGNKAINNIGFLKLIQAIQSTFFFILPPLVLSVLFGSKPANYLFLNKAPKSTQILITLGLIIAAIPLINFTQMLNSKLVLPDFMSGLENWMRNTENAATQLTEKFLSTSTISGLLINIFIMSIIPAIGEELTFRGLFQRIFSNWTKNYHLGILLSAALFSAFHMQFYGFLPRFLLGVAFGYMLVWSGTIWLPIAAHFFNNFLGVLAYYLFNRGIIDKQFDTIGTEGDHVIFPLINSILLVAILMYWLYSLNTKKPS